MASDQMGIALLPVIPSRMEMEIRDGNLPLVNAVRDGEVTLNKELTVTFK